MAEKEKKYEAVAPDQAPEIYRLLEELVRKYHASDLAEAKIGIMLVYGVKPDADEKVWWGKARLVSERDREYHDHDFIVDLNFDVWRALEPAQQRALLDHELMHCGRRENDQTGESTFYLRKHDLEEFHDIVQRHGVKWRPAAEEFVKRALGQKDPTLFDEAPTAQAGLFVAPTRAEETAKIDEANAQLLDGLKRIEEIQKARAARPGPLDVARAQISLQNGDRAPAERVLAAERAHQATAAACPQALSQDLRAKLAERGLVFVGDPEKHGKIEEKTIALALNGLTAAKGRKKHERDAIEMLQKLGWGLREATPEVDRRTAAAGAAS